MPLIKLDLHHTLNYWKDDFNFYVVKFPYICSTIPTVPADGLYFSQLKRCSASWGSPSWIVLSFIESVSRMNNDMLGLWWLQVISFIFAHDLSSCVTYDRLMAWSSRWMPPIVEHDLIDQLDHLCQTPVVMGFMLLIQL